MLTSNKLFYIIAAASAVEISVACVFIRAEVGHCAMIMITQMVSAAKAVWEVVRNPWTLIGYTLFYYIWKYLPGVLLEVSHVVENERNVTTGY